MDLKIQSGTSRWEPVDHKDEEKPSSSTGTAEEHESAPGDTFDASKQPASVPNHTPTISF